MSVYWSITSVPNSCVGSRLCLLYFCHDCSYHRQESMQSSACLLPVYVSPSFWKTSMNVSVQKLRQQSSINLHCKLRLPLIIIILIISLLASVVGHRPSPRFARPFYHGCLVANNFWTCSIRCAILYFAVRCFVCGLWGSTLWAVMSIGYGTFLQNDQPIVIWVSWRFLWYPWLLFFFLILKIWDDVTN